MGGGEASVIPLTSPVRWVLAVTALVCFFVIAVMNIHMLVSNLRHSKAHGASGIPWIGGLAGCLGLLVAPSELLRSLWWIPMILDVGSIPMTILGIWLGMRRILRDHRSAHQRNKS